MAEVTFRDFAMQVMQGQIDTAVATLETLLGLSPARARAATKYFADQIKIPSFLPKAMGLRTALMSGGDDEIATILVDCFGLDGETRPTAVATLRARYPRP